MAVAICAASVEVVSASISSFDGASPSPASLSPRHDNRKARRIQQTTMHTRRRLFQDEQQQQEETTGEESSSSSSSTLFTDSNTNKNDALQSNQDELINMEAAIIATPLSSPPTPSPSPYSIPTRPTAYYHTGPQLFHHTADDEFYRNNNNNNDDLIPRNDEYYGYYGGDENVYDYDGGTSTTTTTTSTSNNDNSEDSSSSSSSWGQTTSGGSGWGNNNNNNNNDNSSPRSNNTYEETDFREFIAFVGWYAFLIFCCLLPTICAYYRRRRNARALQENFLNIQSRLAEIEARRMEREGMGGTGGLEDGMINLEGDNRNQDWEVSIAVF